MKHLLERHHRNEKEMQQLDDFIEAVCSAARAGDEKKLQALEAQNIYSLHVCNSQTDKAIYLLAQEGHHSGVQCLLAHQGEFLAALKGAASGGHQTDIEKPTKALQEANCRSTVELAIVEGAARGGDFDRMYAGIKEIAVIREEEEDNFYIEESLKYTLESIARHLALGGHIEQAQKFCAIEAVSSFEILAGAIIGGHMDYVKSCLQPSNPITNHFVFALYLMEAGFIKAAENVYHGKDSLLQWAASTGQFNYVKTNIDGTRDYTRIADEAGRGGHCRIANWLIDEKDADAKTVIVCVEEGGHLAYANALKKKYHDKIIKRYPYFTGF